MKKYFTLFFAAFLFTFSYGQETFPVNGVYNKNHNYYAFTHARIVVDYKTIIPDGTLLIQDGKIISADEKVTIPKDAVVYDLKGKSIYPSLIDIYSNYGMPPLPKASKSFMPQMESKTNGAYDWNQAVKPQTNAVADFHNNPTTAEELIKLGFGAVLTSQQDGIVQGSAAFVTLGTISDNESVLNGKAAALYSFDKGSSTQDYPSSLMGSIALIRQTYLDAEWYKATKHKKEFNLSLEAFNTLQNIPQIFEVNDKFSALRADKIGDEFNVNYIIKGDGDEYQRLDAIKNTNDAFIIPINFPEPYDVENPYDAMMVNYADMKNWELAPLNPGALANNNITFAITSSGLKNPADFWKNMRKAIKYGLSEQDALKALTVTPADMLKESDEVGSLKSGMLANFIICSGDLFDENNIIYSNWIQGNPYSINDINTPDIRGNYKLTIGNNSFEFKISGEVLKPQGIIIPTDTTKKIPVSITVSGQNMTLNYDLKDSNGMINLSGTIAENAPQISGNGQNSKGDWITWKADLTSAYTEKQKKDTLQKNIPSLSEVMYPFCGFGEVNGDDTLKTFQRLKSKFENRDHAVLIKNATVWTSEKDSVLNNTDVYIVDGKIVAIGKNISATGGAFATVIDATGKYLTAGIVDEHSHIAISGGVNEGAEACSAEVRIGDVINADDISIYRSLAGGVTTAQLLHGSANPVGGQNALVKLRWGKLPEEMKVANAPGFIKFALGENVKQSNWGDFQNVRFPQTRMGVEQSYYDDFTRAKEYEANWKTYNALPSKKKAETDPPREDLQLDALVEILNNKRFITCHSYVQSEMNMLLHVADSMGFHINTFTHGLEGYKIADKIKAAGTGVGTFSDWWAYKMEVLDAIPYNATILDKMGIVTAINSDDPEMQRRLNQEAAKSVKYGKISEQEAWKFVTINPAKLLHLDNELGSIKVGKDGDVVIWSGDPLSVYSKAEKTFIDGICYYDMTTDSILRVDMNKNKSEIIQEMILAKHNGETVRKVIPKKHRMYDCDDIEQNYMSADNN